jgi:hypothetical protein
MKANGTGFSRSIAVLMREIATASFSPKPREPAEEVVGFAYSLSIYMEEELPRLPRLRI